MKRRFIRVCLAACLLAGLAFVSGCENPRTCTLIGCEDGVFMTIGNIAPDTVYDITIESVDETRSCVIDTTDPTAMAVSCGEVTQLWDPSDQAQFRYPNTPESMTITVTENTTVLLETTVTPAYNEFAPNGEECGPICVQASVMLSL